MMPELGDARERMVSEHIAARGIDDPAVLAAMRSVPREAFIPEDLVEFAYEDTPLPIEREQTISQPYIVALMTALLKIRSGERVLEIGTGSGYAAAVLSQVAREVFTVERHGELAKLARERFERLGYSNIRVLHGDGTLGWPEHGPYDGIVVAAGGPSVPKALLQQLRLGGRLVIPVGEDPRTQRLLRITRVSAEDYHREDLGGVRFVQLIGEQGWAGGGPLLTEAPGEASRPASIATLLRETVQRIDDIETADLDSLLERIGDARVVLLGEATHGTSEFYRMRSRITRELIRQRGFNLVALEADWPDAARVDAYIRDAPALGGEWRPFSRFPLWMWRNHEFLELVEWLREFNAGTRDPERKVGLHGLDMYSLFTSIQAVIEYLDRVDPETARIARRRYGCLSPWERDPAVYGRATLTGQYKLCEDQVVHMLRDLLERRIDYAGATGTGSSTRCRTRG
jgi:protein-L-isoaspartate(D-aspartate) O-methyltransferase